MRTIILAISLLLPSTSLLAQGPLAPPPGAPYPTMKSLFEVEPRIAVNANNTPGDTASLYVISQAGSYYLTGNLIGPDGKHGITISANQVTLDLMGFKVLGGASSGSGIRSSGQNVVIRNGVVMQWFGHGVDLGYRNRVENLQAIYNLGTGINATNFCEATNCLVDSNAKGIEMGMESTVSKCWVSDNTTLGIGVGPRSRISDNTVVRTSAGPGISVGNNSSIINCVASTNSQTGIAGSFGCTVEGCTSSDNGTGFTFGSGAVVRRCTATTSNANGMEVINAGGAAGVLIEDCTASNNTGDGIVGRIGSTIRNCLVRANGDDGIEVLADCLVTGNNCTNNGVATPTGSGIHATGAGNRIEENTAILNKKGFWIEGPVNIILRNTARYNPSATPVNFEIAPNNSYGPIVDVTGAGNLGAVPNANHPWANFVH